VEVESCASSSGAGAGPLPFWALALPLPWVEQISKFLALAVSLRSLSFDFVAHLLVISQRRLSGQLTRYWNRPTSEGQFPFPLAPEFWGSWTDSWLETNLPRTVPIVE
jgi:hypothetical protein